MPANHTPQFDDLPPVMKEVRTRPLFVVRPGVKPIVTVGQTPGASAASASLSPIHSRATGSPVPCSTAVTTGRPCAAIPARRTMSATLRTDDGVNLLMSYHGVRHGPADVIQSLEHGEVVDPASYYFRINPMFEAPAGRCEWLNGILAIGLGHRFAYGPVYSVFEVL